MQSACQFKILMVLLSADSVGRKAQAGGHALHAGLNADSVRLSADGIRPQARRPAPHVGSGTDAVRTKERAMQTAGWTGCMALSWVFFYNYGLP